MLAECLTVFGGQKTALGSHLNPSFAADSTHYHSSEAEVVAEYFRLEVLVIQKWSVALMRWDSCKTTKRISSAEADN